MKHVPLLIKNNTKRTRYVIHTLDIFFTELSFYNFSMVCTLDNGSMAATFIEMMSVLPDTVS